ncbi:MAG: HEAT repeat domain-containing protein [Myxococcota bacterium]
MIGAIWLGLGAVAAAGPLREPVMTLLNSHEEPIDAGSVKALGRGAAAELLEISQDPAVPPTRRARAITALSHVDMTTEIRNALTTHLRSSEPLLQRHAARSLVPLGDAAIDDLNLALASDDVQLRIAAAEALGRIGTTRSARALRNRLARETHPLAKDALTTALEAR